MYRQDHFILKMEVPIISWMITLHVVQLNIKCGEHFNSIMLRFKNFLKLYLEKVFRPKRHSIIIINVIILTVKQFIRKQRGMCTKFIGWHFSAKKKWKNRKWKRIKRISVHVLCFLISIFWQRLLTDILYMVASFTHWNCNNKCHKLQWK